MHVIETTVDVVGPTTLRITTLVDTTPDKAVAKTAIGEGPNGYAIPDKIVRMLIDERPGSVSLKQLQQQIGGNEATVARQAWTLATGAPDMQRRFRGWVTSAGRGRYALTAAAVERLADPDCPKF